MQTTPTAATQTAYGATPIADSIKRLVRNGDCADPWRLYVRDNATQRAHLLKEITINPALTDSVIMSMRTASRAKAAKIMEGVVWKP
jgi:hypothetical protein